MKNIFAYAIVVLILIGHVRGEEAEKPSYASMEKAELISLIENQYDEIKRLREEVDRLAQSILDNEKRDEPIFIIGGVQIVIPALAADFVEIGNENQELMEVFIPSTNRLVCTYVLADDLPRISEHDEDLTLSQYGMVQVNREAEDKDMESKDYEGLVEYFNEFYGSDWDPLMDKAGKDLNRRFEDHDIDARMKAGEVVKLGKLFSIDDACGYGVIMPFDFQIEDDDESHVMAVVLSLVRVKERLLFVYVYAMYEDGGTLKWIGATSEEWCKDILAANE